MRQSCSILLVDDENDFRESMTFLLELAGFRVLQAADGSGALDLILSGLQPHLILIDQRMPGLTGSETLQELRARGFDVPAILVSAAADIMVVARQHGFDAALAKPIGMADVIRTVREIVDRRGVDCQAGEWEP